MIAACRKQFNTDFTSEKYQHYLHYLHYFNESYPNALDFRVAETPIFLDNIFQQKLLSVGDFVCAQILSEDFKSITQNALQNISFTPHEPDFPNCLVMDFAIVKDNQENIVPALIELQGFPSLFAFEIFQDEAIRKNYTIPEHFSPYLNGYDKQKYLDHLNKMIKGNKNEHTILLEILPHQQKTRIDFYCTEHYLNIPIVCISEIFQKGNALYYSRQGLDIKIDRIYNRIVADELYKQSDLLQEKGKLLLNDLDITWVTHPHHFYRISKYFLPFLNHPWVPRTQFLNQLKSIPNNLENFVLKPLFSFAGQGVIIDVTPKDLENIKDPQNWILQEKVNYLSCIETPNGPAKAEIRLFYFWDDIKKQYVATMNLIRLSKGKMIGVNYNQKAEWVGGTLAYFENE